MPINNFDVLSALKPLADLYQAQVLEGQINTPREILILKDISLATEKTRNNPLIVDFPFRSFRIQEATDAGTYLKFLPYGMEASQGDDGAIYRKKETFRSDIPIPRACFYWPAQAGKTLTIEMYRRSEVLPGSFETSISEVFTGITMSAAVTVTTTATLIAAADSTRKVLNLHNYSGDTVWLGDSTVTVPGGLFPGLPLFPGQSVPVKNTAAWYGITVSGSSVVHKLTET